MTAERPPPCDNSILYVRSARERLDMTSNFLNLYSHDFARVAIGTIAKALSEPGGKMIAMETQPAGYENGWLRWQQSRL